MPTLTTTAPATQPLARRVVAALLCTLVAAALLGPLSHAGAAHATYVVPVGTALPAGSQVLAHLDVASALVVSAPAAPLGAAAADAPLRFESFSLRAPDGDGPDGGVRSTGADEVWGWGNRGGGAVVALVDSGIADVPALGGAVVAELDFTGTGGGDPLGHGTFMASLIAGRGEEAPGVAPDAELVSLKVGDTEGATTLATVLAALDWLHGPGRQAGIRIAVLALGADADTPAARLLDQAVDRLARADVLVVTAAGNDGPGRLTSPATATRSFSVGAFDSDVQDGSAPVPSPFSGTGRDRARVPQPDALAAGVSLLGHVPEDSIIGEAHAEDREGTLLRGTGTSMSTGLAAGVAALALAARPDLGGTALDLALRTDAGVIDAPTAVEAAIEAPTAGDQPAPGAGPGQGTGGPGDIHWRNLRWKNLRWKGGDWANLRWKGGDWANLRWKADEWANLRWKADEWANLRWKADDWANLRWKAESWTNLRWKAQGWTMLEAP